MIGNYGYMEEGKLGKPYNFRLMKRLSRYALPYKKTVALALFLSILLTFCMLAIPYLSKIAIDRYIISSWYRVDVHPFGDMFSANMPERYRKLLEKSQDGSAYFVNSISSSCLLTATQPGPKPIPVPQEGLSLPYRQWFHRLVPGQTLA